MTENTTKSKRIITYHDPIVEYDPATSYVTFIGASRGADDKYGVVLPIPQTDEECKERYNVGSLQGMVVYAIQKFATMPQYKEAFNKDGTLKDGGHEILQRLADEYKVGQHKAGNSQVAQLKAKVTAAESVAIAVAKKAGLSPDEVRAMIAEAQVAK